MGVAIEILNMPIAFILPYQFVELMARYKLSDLEEYKLTVIHNLDVISSKTNKSISNQKIDVILYLIKH